MRLCNQLHRRGVCTGALRCPMHARSSAPPRGSMSGKPITGQTRALCCREITRGLARGGNTTEGGFLFDTHSPTQLIVITRVRRRQGLAAETLRRRTPSAVPAPGVPESPLILGSRPTAGCRGMGCRTASTRTAATPLSGDGGAVRFA